MVYDEGFATVRQMQLAKIIIAILICFVLAGNRQSLNTVPLEVTDELATVANRDIGDGISLQELSHDQGVVADQVALLKELSKQLGGVKIVGEGGIDNDFKTMGSNERLIADLKKNTYALIGALQGFQEGYQSEQATRLFKVQGFPVRSGRISSPFGYRMNPFSSRYEEHKGVDVAAQEGDEILATGDGVVTHVGDAGAYGVLIEIDHGDDVKTRYAHCRYAYVKKGESVTIGKAIGLVGSTGRSTGPHVHYEIRVDGMARNPLFAMSKESASNI
jgi:murein DD-endopeptidase MepM/ murein hydrolase activator NlpD